jgi:hypothetical protein
VSVYEEVQHLIEVVVYRICHGVKFFKFGQAGLLFQLLKEPLGVGKAKCAGSNPHR